MCYIVVFLETASSPASRLYQIVRSAKHVGIQYKKQCEMLETSVAEAENSTMN